MHLNNNLGYTIYLNVKNVIFDIPGYKEFHSCSNIIHWGVATYKFVVARNS